MSGENKITKQELEKRLLIVDKLILRGHSVNEIERIVNNESSEYNWNLTNRQIRRYAKKCIQSWEKYFEKDREKLMIEHLAKRNELYQLSITDKDYRTALAIQRDIAELQQLYRYNLDSITDEKVIEIDKNVRFEKVIRVFELIKKGETDETSRTSI